MREGPREELLDDHGLFGPGSVTWRVMGEPVLMIGGIRALLLQALHPRSMWGTAQNSELMDRDAAWSRLARTVEFVRVRTYGTHAEVDRIGRRVRRLHSKLTGLDLRTGETFPVDDPENLLWVHLGEVDSYLDVARRAGVGLSAADADAFVDEQRRAAAVVGLDPADVPASVAELKDYYAGMRPRIWACDEARDGLRRMFSPDVPNRLLPLKLAAPGLGMLVVSTLPRWARRMYGLPGLPTSDLAATLALKGLHRTVHVIPERYRYSPDAQRARRLTREHASDPAGWSIAS
ncbi:MULTISPECIES: oxygenase MpaB family protein [Thermomonosporaceae]|uniref:oxygenase MpaB family protein n=1 Tax=Thermomonosporaceae TaxID=2012 RepID=UPI00255AC291|nr:MULTISPECIES: oxygenase MpaB family protein [Thermomonosporaceae]MDL4771299.1 oxygenase MpaB family protein [Actinomadura xylanilytica]